MTMHRILGLLLAVTATFTPFSRAAAADDVDNAAQVIVFGEQSHASGPSRGDHSLAQRVDGLKHQLASDRNAAAAVAAKAARDAFGPNAGAVAADAGQPLTYAEWMLRNVQALSQDAQKYEAAIRAAYPVVIHRDVYPEEIAYWKKHGVAPYYLLLAAIENWARRNQPGLMVTAGAPTISINSSYLTTVRVAPSSAGDVRAALGLPAAAHEKESSTLGHVLAAGGDAFETDGGMFFVAAGR